jgi:hypothetical protein
MTGFLRHTAKNCSDFRKRSIIFLGFSLPSLQAPQARKFEDKQRSSMEIDFKLSADWEALSE